MFNFLDKMLLNLCKVKSFLISMYLQRLVERNQVITQQVTVYKYPRIWLDSVFFGHHATMLVFLIETVPLLLYYVDTMHSLTCAEKNCKNLTKCILFAV